METKRLLLKAVGGAALLPAAVLAGTSSSPARTREEHYFPNAILETHEGKKVRFYDDLIKGKIVILNMVYTACTRTCPPITAAMLSVQQALGDRVGRDIFMYSLSLQPELDSPQALRDYARKYGVKPGWTFLTGKRDDMDIIRRKLGFYDSDPVADADITRHAGVLRIGNEARNRWFMVPAISPMPQIMRGILNV